MGIETLLGRTLKSVENRDDEAILFETAEGERFRLFHDQDCCESVRVEDVCGELDDLVGSPLTMAEEVSIYEGHPPEGYDPTWGDTYTWTFYKLATVKGYVTIRWLGQSNGYYSESVDFGPC